MTFIFYILIWSALGFWGYKIMEDKNRSKVLGAVLGFVFGFIGIIICYCHKTKPVVANPVIESEVPVENK